MKKFDETQFGHAFDHLVMSAPDDVGSTGPDSPTRHDQFAAAGLPYSEDLMRSVINARGHLKGAGRGQLGSLRAIHLMFGQAWRAYIWRLRTLPNRVLRPRAWMSAMARTRTCIFSRNARIDRALTNVSARFCFSRLLEYF